MHLSSLFIVPALTLFQSSVAAYSLISPNAIAHSRDFHTDKRQIRNADYAGAPPPNQEPTSNSITYSHPSTTTSTDYTTRYHAAASRPTDPAQGSSEGSPSIGSQPRYFYDSNALSGGLASTRDKRNAEDSARSADHDHRSRSPRLAVALTEVSQNLPARAFSSMRKSQINSSRDVITRTFQGLTAKRFAAGNSFVDVSSLDSKHKREVLHPNTHFVELRNLAMQTTQFPGDKRKDPIQRMSEA